MAYVTSRVNGLQIQIPADARGVIPRFSTKGANQLVFADQTPEKTDKARKVLAKEKPVSLGSNPAD